MNVTIWENRLRETEATVLPGPCDGSVQTAKIELRAAILRERNGMSAASRRAVARGLRDAFLELPQLCHTRCVSVYTSCPTEPGTYLLLEALASQGVNVVRPVIHKATTLRWLASREISHPSHPRNAPVHHHRRLPGHHANGRAALFVFVPVVLVPALAVDTQGRRLGQGRGHYDRLLTLLDPATLVLAAVHDTELFDSAVEPVPEEPHDVRVDAALTPSRIHYLTDQCPAPEPGHAP